MTASAFNLECNFSPFDLADDTAYRAWRARKLEWMNADPLPEIVAISDPSRLSTVEFSVLQRQLQHSNYAVYQLPADFVVNKAWIIRFGQWFGLNRLDSNLCADEDSVTSLRVVGDGRHAGYIPYSNRPINWHTDGYYNPNGRYVRAFILHCAQPAATGGENSLLDHEFAYLALRDADPNFVTALMHPQAMTIPPNEENGVEIREAETGPVFSIDPQTGCLHMRYTARKRNIQWRDDATTQAAVTYLQGLLEAQAPPIFTHRLQAGQGLICNNILHNRSGFADSDAQQRLYFRARYYDRIADTSTLR
ncbi:MAG: TauD/TfdA family dioxygenase [Thiotrichales bacterium]